MRGRAGVQTPCQCARERARAECGGWCPCRYPQLHRWRGAMPYVSIAPTAIHSRVPCALTLYGSMPCAVRLPIPELVGRDRPTDALALRHIAAERAEPVQRILIPDAFGDDRQVQFWPQLDSRWHN